MIFTKDIEKNGNRVTVTVELEFIEHTVPQTTDMKMKIPTYTLNAVRGKDVLQYHPNILPEKVIDLLKQIESDTFKYLDSVPNGYKYHDECIASILELEYKSY